MAVVHSHLHRCRYHGKYECEHVGVRLGVVLCPLQEATDFASGEQIWCLWEVARLRALLEHVKAAVNFVRRGEEVVGHVFGAAATSPQVHEGIDRLLAIVCVNVLPSRNGVGERLCPELQVGELCEGSARENLIELKGEAHICDDVREPWCPEVEVVDPVAGPESSLS